MFKVISATLAIMAATGWTRLYRLSDSSLSFRLISVATSVMWSLLMFLFCTLLFQAFYSPEAEARELANTYTVEKVVFDGSYYHLALEDGSDLKISRTDFFLENIDESEHPDQIKCEKYTGFSEFTYQDEEIYRVYKSPETPIEYIEHYQPTSEEDTNEH